MMCAETCAAPSSKAHMTCDDACYTFHQNGKTARDKAAENGKTAEFDAAVKKGLAMRGEFFFFSFLFLRCQSE